MTENSEFAGEQKINLLTIWNRKERSQSDHAPPTWGDLAKRFQELSE